MGPVSDRRPPAALRTTLTTALCLGGVLALSAPALADPGPAPSAAPAAAAPAPAAIAAAQKQAVALQTRVSALQVRTEQAVEHYNAVQADLEQAAAAHARARSVLAEARTEQAALDLLATDRIRALYMLGGMPGLSAMALQSDTANEALQGYHDAGSILRDDHERVAAATAAAQRAAAAEKAMAAAELRQRQLKRQAAAAAASVKRQLAATTKLLQSASAEVQDLLAAQAAAQKRAADALARLVRQRQQATGEAGVALGLATVATGKQVQALLADAEAQLGKPYQWGATGPTTFDCSGLTLHAYAAAGIALPRTSRQQWFAGVHPTLASAAPGDLLFWASNPADPTSIHHVAIYVGGGYMIAAPHTGTVVQVQRVYLSGFFGVTRVIPPAPVPAPRPGS